MRQKFILSLAFGFILFLTACANRPELLSESQIPQVNKQEVIAEKTYDFVYLATFDVANGLSNWVVEKTIRDEGLIRLHNKQYSRLDDSSSRVINLVIRRIDAKQTGVSLAPESRRVIGADEVLKAIRIKLNA